MLRVAHTNTHRQRDRQTHTNTPTHLPTIRSNSVQFTPSFPFWIPGYILAEAPGQELRAYINADRQTSPASARPSPRSAWPLLSHRPWTACRCARLVVSLSVKSQTRRIRRQRYGQSRAPAAYATSSPPSPPPPAFRLPPLCIHAPPLSHTHTHTPSHCHGRYLINQSINSRFFFYLASCLVFSPAPLCVIFVIIFISLFFIILICLSLAPLAASQPRLPFILFVLAARLFLFSLSWQCLRILDFAFALPPNPRAESNRICCLFSFLFRMPGCVYDRKLYEKSSKRAKSSSFDFI